MRDEKMFGGRTVGNLWRLAIFLAAFAIVVYVLIEFRVWSGDFTLYFIRLGEWEMLVLISLIVAGITTGLTKLLQWETRAVTRPRGRG